MSRVLLPFLPSTLSKKLGDANSVGSDDSEEHPIVVTHIVTSHVMQHAGMRFHPQKDTKGKPVQELSSFQESVSFLWDGCLLFEKVSNGRRP
jgi:hypothetical protein